MANRVGIALGANLGDRLAQMKKACTLLAQLSPAGSKLLQAPIYHSEPLDCPDNSPDFYNTVIEISYGGTPLELLTQTQLIEKHLGRPAIHGHHTPRLIDLDILYFGNETLQTEKLTLPHPRMTERSFVLQPLAHMRPDLILPHDHLTVADHWRQLDSVEPALRIAHLNW